MGKEVLYEGTIRGLVTGESRQGIQVGMGGSYTTSTGVYFVIKLEEGIGIGGNPDGLPEFRLWRFGRGLSDH